ncbi:MAG: DUF4340 domain-containing protein [Planctomycetota bacterium]
MNNRNLFILGLVAVTMVVWAVAMSKISSIPYAPPGTSGYLIQGLDPDQIASITIIGKGNEQVRLVRRRQNFVVANKDNYPAMASEINKLITTCLDIKTAELYTDNPKNYKDLGVTEKDASNIVKFFAADSNLITGVIIGKQKQRTEGIAYVRRAEDKSVYVAAAQIPWIKKRATDYVEQELINVEREDVESVTVSDPNETYLLRAGDNDTITLDNLPEGKSLKNDVANVVFTALAEMRFDDVNAESSRKDLTFDRRYICRLKDSTAYTFWLAKEGDKWFIKCDAQFADQSPVTMTKGKVESAEELKKKEAKLLALAAAEQFSRKQKGWVYQIPEHKAVDMTEPLSELIEDSTKPQTQKQADVNELLGEVNKPVDE